MVTIVKLQDLFHERLAQFHCRYYWGKSVGRSLSMGQPLLLVFPSEDPIVMVLELPVFKVESVRKVRFRKE